MITTTLLAIASSITAEIVTYLNQKLTGTFLEGRAAFILALATALAGGAVKVFYIDGQPLPTTFTKDSLKDLFPAFAQVWTISQIYFILIAQKLNLEVKKN